MSSSNTRRAITAGHFRLPRALVTVAFPHALDQVETLPVLICPLARLAAGDRAVVLEQGINRRVVRAGGVTLQAFGESWLLELLAPAAPMSAVLPPEARRRLQWDGFSSWFIDLAELALRRQCRAILLTTTPASPSMRTP